jgi:hypothetical protein
MTYLHVKLAELCEGENFYFMLPMGITVLDLSAYVGLIAVGAITLNMLLGLLMAFRYSPHRSWPHRRFNYFRFHNWTAYIALAVSILHPVILLFNKDPHFRIRDLVYPVHSPSQPLDNSIGGSLSICSHLSSSLPTCASVSAATFGSLFTSLFISQPPRFSGTAYLPIPA